MILLSKMKSVFLLFSLLLLAFNAWKVDSTSTESPTPLPTFVPTSYPSTSVPTSPSSSPTRQPSRQPSQLPSNQPSAFPTTQPSSQPTSMPSKLPQDSEYAFKVSLFIGLAWIVFIAITWLSEYFAGKNIRKNLELKENASILRSYGNLKRMTQIAPDPETNASFLEMKNNALYIKEYINDYFKLILSGSLSCDITDWIGIFHKEALENHLYISVIGSNRIGAKRWITILRLLSSLTIAMCLITFLYDLHIAKNNNTCYSHKTMSSCIREKATFDNDKSVCIWDGVSVCSYNDTAEFYDNFAFIVILLIVVTAMGPISFCLDVLFFRWLNYPSSPWKDKLGRIVERDIMSKKIEEEVKKGLDVLYLEVLEERQSIIWKGDIERLMVFDAQWGIKIAKSSANLSNVLNGDYDFNQVKFIYSDHIKSDLRQLMLDAVNIKFCLESENENRTGIELFVNLFIDVLGNNTLAAKMFRQKVYCNLDIYYVKILYVLKWLILIAVLLGNVALSYLITYFCEIRTTNWLNCIMIEFFCYIFVDFTLIEGCKLFFVHFYNNLLLNDEILEAKHSIRIAADLMVSNNEKILEGEDDLTAEFSATRYIFLSSYLSVFFPHMLESSLAKFIIRKLPEKNGSHWSSKNHQLSSIVSSLELSSSQKLDRNGNSRRNSRMISSIDGDDDYGDNDSIEDGGSHQGSMDEWRDDKSYMTLSEYFWQKFNHFIMCLSSRLNIEQQKLVYHISIPPLVYLIILFIYYLIDSIKTGIYIVVLLVLFSLAVYILKKVYKHDHSIGKNTDNKELVKEDDIQHDRRSIDPDSSLFPESPGNKATNQRDSDTTVSKKFNQEEKNGDKDLVGGGNSSNLGGNINNDSNKVNMSNNSNTNNGNINSNKGNNSKNYTSSIGMISPIVPSATPAADDKDSSPNSYSSSPEIIFGDANQSTKGSVDSSINSSNSNIVTSISKGLPTGNRSFIGRRSIRSDSFADEESSDDDDDSPAMKANSTDSSRNLPSAILFKDDPDLNSSNYGHSKTSLPPSTSLEVKEEGKYSRAIVNIVEVDENESVHSKESILLTSQNNEIPSNSSNNSSTARPSGDPSDSSAQITNSSNALPLPLSLRLSPNTLPENNSVANQIPEYNSSRNQSIKLTSTNQSSISPSNTASGSTKMASRSSKISNINSKILNKLDNYVNLDDSLSSFMHLANDNNTSSVGNSDNTSRSFSTTNNNIISRSIDSEKEATQYPNSKVDSKSNAEQVPSTSTNQMSLFDLLKYEPGKLSTKEYGTIDYNKRTQNQTSSEVGWNDNLYQSLKSSSKMKKPIKKNGKSLSSNDTVQRK